jgi:hypothetical protein
MVGNTRGLKMIASAAVSKQPMKQPMAYCAPCSERTPHRYERLGVNGRLTSRAICLICNNDSRRDPALQKKAMSGAGPGLEN